MYQIQKMFMESNARMKKIMNSDYDSAQIFCAQREFEGQIKLINAVVSAFGIQSKNERAQKGLDRMNIMDDTTAIDLMLGDPEEDKVKCPIKNKLIYRAECLDYSGEKKHYEDCRGCEIGEKTRKLLVPIPKHYPQQSKKK